MAVCREKDNPCDRPAAILTSRCQPTTVPRRKTLDSIEHPLHTSYKCFTVEIRGRINRHSGTILDHNWAIQNRQAEQRPLSRYSFDASGSRPCRVFSIGYELMLGCHGSLDLAVCARCNIANLDCATKYIDCRSTTCRARTRDSRAYSRPSQRTC